MTNRFAGSGVWSTQTSRPSVPGRAMWGICMPGRWSAAPSSTGTGKSGGRLITSTSRPYAVDASVPQWPITRSVSGMLIDFDEAGVGSTALLLHAGVADRRMWEPLWPVLVEQYHGVRVDLRGFGGTPLPPEPYTNAADVIAVLDHLKVERAALVGSSMGGRVALEVAAAYPD